MTQQADMSLLHGVIARWVENPTADHARAYHEMWMRLARGVIADAHAEWFYCCQPRALWDQLRAMGLNDET